MIAHAQWFHPWRCRGIAVDFAVGETLAQRWRAAGVRGCRRRRRCCFAVGVVAGRCLVRCRWVVDGAGNALETAVGVVVSDFHGMVSDAEEAGANGRRQEQ